MNALMNRQAELAVFIGFSQKKLNYSVLLNKITNLFENRGYFT